MHCKKMNAYNFRPSTPIFDLLEHKYQDKWLQDRRKMEISKRQEETKVWNVKKRYFGENMIFHRPDDLMKNA